jgi:hypothetical protein
LGSNLHLFNVVKPVIHSCMYKSDVSWRQYI